MRDGGSSDNDQRCGFHRLRAPPDDGLGGFLLLRAAAAPFCTGVPSLSGYLSRCVSVDLEVGTKDRRINAIGAVRADTGKRFTWSRGDRDPARALAELDDFADGAAFVLGHNLIAFDLPCLQGANPGLRLLRLPAVDTLRLSPLAFRRNPYHHLVKHYQDGGIRRGRLNDPVLDARLALELFTGERSALQRNASPALLQAWHWLTTPEPEGADRSMHAFFAEIRSAVRPTEEEALAAINGRLEGKACVAQARAAAAEAARDPTSRWALAYALAWLSVAGGNSVMPPWVRHQFPEAARLVRRLRDTPCTDPACGWCRERHDARKELAHWFGFKDFRPEPADESGRSMQRAIVESVMAGEHVLGILPTGTGKSLCYQVPALSRYHKTGALTVVVSPLVALMADQVAGLEAHGIDSCVAVNGLLSMPERADALDRVRLGGVGILLISPEQLRSRSLRRVLDQREIGGWVLDEAHCLSRWGHDFRPDYLYIGRFIRETAEKTTEKRPPPVLCLTATAKPDVRADIARHFEEKLDIALRVFDGGAERSNLAFEVVPTSGGEKFALIHQLLEDRLPEHTPGGAIVYCATRRRSEEVADYLRDKDVPAGYFHAGLLPETKKDVQRRFIEGELRAIAATNAFGMGIDKPDVRLVVHADIPGSLENYFQEAGRAGRDREPASCVLLYATDDVERQFGMSARSRLTRHEIRGIYKALRNLDRKKRLEGEVVATAGEILGEDEEQAFERDSATDDTRVRTALAWLEEAGLLTRDENRVQVFPSSLRVTSMEEARKRLAGGTFTDHYRRSLTRIAELLMEARPDEGVTTDELMLASRLSPEGVRGALYDLERLGICSNDTALTAFVHTGVERSSRKRLAEAAALEEALIAHMREAAPELGKGESAPLHLRIAAQTLRERGDGLPDPLPLRLLRILRSIAHDGRGEDADAGSLSLRKRDAETVYVTLRREWGALEETARRRREAAMRLLEHLLSRLPSGARGTDLLAETTIGKLMEALEADIVLKSKVRRSDKLLDRALLWLHEQEAIRLNKGLAIFRPAMTVRLLRDGRGFTKADFQPLALHYRGQVRQIHVMAAFAERGLTAMREAERLARDYFTLQEGAFLRRWLPDREKETARETTPESWRTIVESLRNRTQQAIVADDREETNVLVLAGPGSGKTRVLVHRIAYLIRVRREDARGILALAYNRHAAVDIRRRLDALIGADARGVTVLTCHGLAMRVAGASFTGRTERPDDELFREVLRRAVEVLRGEGLPPEEADERRDRLLAGFRWILVDEYQDIGKDQYDLISALSGRTLEDEDGKLTLFAVGDDDQNIYAFDGASVAFIRRFEADYEARPIHLTDNYRSTGHIVTAANEVIAPARQRMKKGHPIHVDRAREKDAPGGSWETRDPYAQGRVQILPADRDPIAQARIAVEELRRLSRCVADWDWSRCAVIARAWRWLEPVRAFCAAEGVPAQMADEEIPGFWRLRETRAFVEWLRGREPRVVDGEALAGWVDACPNNPWYDLLRQAVEEHALETGGAETPVARLVEWLAEWGRDVRRRQHGLLLLTAHRAKGLEFDHVVVLDGGWNRVGDGEDADAPRRLYYVAMTRARETLALSRFDGSHPFQDALPAGSPVLRREPVILTPGAPELAYRYVRPSLGEVDLGFAGRLRAGNPVHRAIAALAPGAALKTRVTAGGRWEILDRAGMVVGRLATCFKPPPGMRCRSAEVRAVIGWSREISKPEYVNLIRCDSWEVVVPELVFEPAPTPDTEARARSVHVQTATRRGS